MPASAKSCPRRVADVITKPDPDPQYSWLDMMDGLQRSQSHLPSADAPQSETTMREPDTSGMPGVVPERPATGKSQWRPFALSKGRKP